MLIMAKGLKDDKKKLMFDLVTPQSITGMAEVLTYGASVYWSINRHYFASMFIERYVEDDYDNTSVFTQAGLRF